jgi:pimeloyl-ACP methyl ester carboxylesterase
MLNHQRQGSGEPMVLIHGIGGELCVWEPVVDELAERFDVIAIDLPGFGHSPALPDHETPTPARLAEAVAEFLDELGIDQAHVVGNSLGGWVALELAKIGRALSVTGLCPAGLWGAPVIREGTMVRGRAHKWVRRLRPVIPVLLLPKRARRIALGFFVRDPDKVPYGAAWRMVRSYGRATAYDATSTAMRQNYFHGVESIDVPITLAFGQYDRLIRPTRLDNPGARSVVLPDAGHIPMWDDPELVAKLIEQTAARARTTV